MSIKYEKLIARLQRQTRKDKRRAHQRRGFGKNLGRFLLLEERKKIIKLCWIQALKMRRIVLGSQIRKLGGWNGRGTWKDRAEKISELHAERKKVIEMLETLKPVAQVKNFVNCNPYYIAKLYDVRPEAIYDVLRIYAATGDIKFSRDKRNHLPSDSAKESACASGKKQKRNAFRAPEFHASQVACNGRHPCPAKTRIPKGTTSRTPRLQEKWYRELLASRPRFVAERTRFLDALGPDAKDMRNVDDYFRIGTADEDTDVLPYCEPTKRRHWHPHVKVSHVRVAVEPPDVMKRAYEHLMRFHCPYDAWNWMPFVQTFS